MSKGKLFYTCTDCSVSFNRWHPFKDDQIVRCPKCAQSVGQKALFSDPKRKEKVRERREATCLELYGVTHHAKNKKIQAKTVATQKERYGHVGFESKQKREYSQSLAHTDEANVKRHETCLKHFGVTHQAKNKDFLDSRYDSYKKETGYDHPAHNPEIIHSNKGYDFEGTHFDSSWELAYYIYLRDHKISFIYHPPYSIPYLDECLVERQVYPDFLVQGQFIELKGDQFFNEKGEPWSSYSKDFWWGKYNALVNNGVKIVRLDEIKPYLKYVKQTYGKDYIKTFRRSKKSSTTIENA